MSCSRCGRESSVNVDIDHSGYPLCQKCFDTFWRRFETFMASGSHKWKFKKSSVNQQKKEGE